MWIYSKTSNQETGGSHCTRTPALQPRPLATTFEAECHLVPQATIPSQSTHMAAANSYVHGHQVALVTCSIRIRPLSPRTKHICGNSGTLHRALTIRRGSTSKPFMSTNPRPEYRFSPSIRPSRVRHYHWIFVCSCLRGRLPSGFVRFSGGLYRTIPRYSTGHRFLKRSLIVRGRGPCGRKIVAL